MLLVFEATCVCLFFAEAITTDARWKCVGMISDSTQFQQRVGCGFASVGNFF